MLQGYIALGQCISLWRNSHEEAHLMLTQWSFHLDMSPEVCVLLRETTLRAQAGCRKKWGDKNYG